jgi:hypothetical protein
VNLKIGTKTLVVWKLINSAFCVWILAKILQRHAEDVLLSTAEDVPLSPSIYTKRDAHSVAHEDAMLSGIVNSGPKPWS